MDSGRAGEAVLGPAEGEDRADPASLNMGREASQSHNSYPKPALGSRESPSSPCQSHRRADHTHRDSSMGSGQCDFTGRIGHCELDSPTWRFLEKKQERDSAESHLSFWGQQVTLI